MYKELSLGVYFRQTWIDHRLAFNASFNEILIEPELTNHIWMPDTMIANGRSINQYPQTNMKDSAFLRIRKDGAVTHSIR